MTGPAPVVPTTLGRWLQWLALAVLAYCGLALGLGLVWWASLVCAVTLATLGICLIVFVFDDDDDSPW